MITLATSRSFAVQLNGDREASRAIRSIPGVRWEDKHNEWRIPVACAQFVAEFSEKHRIEVRADAREAIERLHTNRAEGVPLPDLDMPLRNGRTLFAHQKAGVQFLTRRRRAILADDMGLGKTCTSLVAARCFDIPVHVICPASLRDNWAREAEIVGVRIQTHSWAKVPARIPSPFVLIADECFPFDTMVETAMGPLRIGVIVRQGLDVPVYARDESTGALVERRIVRRIEKPIPKNLLRIAHECGEITCTANHKIWTSEYGYIRADEIAEKATNENIHLHILRSALPGEDGLAGDVLLKGACEQAQRESLAGGGSLPTDAETLHCGAEAKRYETTRCGGADAKKQSDEQPGGKGENAGETQRTAVQAQGRERTHDTPAVCARGRAENPDGVCDQHGGREEEISKHTDIVQGGSCAPGNKDRDRGRREVSPSFEQKAGGHKKRGGFERSRVVGVAVLESRDRYGHLFSSEEDNFVYNLEVEIDHNYIADGVLVSNCHYAQSGKKSQRGAAFLDLAEQADAVFLLTGTPMKNGRPVNMYPLLKAVRSPLALNKGWFERRYCDAKPSAFSSWDTTGASHLDELGELGERVRPVMLRRMKTECLDLPDKTRVMRDAEQTAEAKRLYAETFNAAMNRYTEKILRGDVSEESEALVRFGFMRMAGSVAKIASAVEIAEEVLEQGGQIVIFTAFLESARRIAASFAGSCLLIGETAQDERQKLVDRFQAGQSRVFVTTFGAGGVGITLTRAQTVLLVDRPWTPGDCYQAEDRIHRIGQKSNVLSIWLQWDDTDKAVDALLEAKTEKIEVVMAGRKVQLAAGMTQKQFAEIAARKK